MPRRALKLAIWYALAGFAISACEEDPSSDDMSRVDPRTPGNPTPGNPSGGTSGGDWDIDNPDFDPTMQPRPMVQMPSDRCTATDLETRRITPNVMLVVDGSTSMEMPYNPNPDAGMGGGPSRWNAVREALVSPDGVVPQLQDLVKFGLAVYGTVPSCPLPLGVVAPMLNNEQAIANGLPGAPPGFTTPSGEALQEVVNMLPDPLAVGPDQESEPQVIIFATDGDPNSCEFFDTNYQPSINAAMAAQAKNQRLFVISVGNEASEQHLQELANIGAGLAPAANPGATVYYPEDPAALAATLEELIGAELSCDVSLEGKGVRPGKECNGTVKLNGEELACDADGSGTEGFQLIDPHHILLKGAACETYKSSASAVLNASFPCDALLE